MSELTLYYHANKRGLAEKIRLMLCETGLVGGSRFSFLSLRLKKLKGLTA